ncbi:hypothetical protein J5500_05000, partial [Candidatus Saccharibacteria bacterium]|nr:hypothetical protein [Candidatus Saccharibacteria bacterium]
MSGGDILEWNLSNIGNTDIILFPSKIGLNSSTQFLAVGADSSKIQYKAQTGDYTLKGDGNQSNCGSIGFIKSFSSTYDIQASFTIRYANAARGISGQYYDIYMTFSNMKVHPGGDTKSHGAPIIYGCSGYLEYNAFKYDSDDGVMGMKTDVTVRLYKSGSSMAKVTNADGTQSVQITGTQIENGHKLAWGVADVDIRDKINDSNGASAPNYHYDSSHQWAEHVRFYNVARTYNANLNDNHFFGPVYVSSDSELAKSEQGDYNQNMTIYHNFDTDDPYNDGTDDTDLIVRINPRYAKFMWQGSDCSSAAIALAGTMYTGHTLIYKGNSTASGNLLTSSKNLSSYPNNRSVKVQANSQSLTFHHEIYRNTQGPTNDNEEYYVEAATGNGPARGSSSSHRSYTSTKDRTQTVYTKDDPSGNGFSVGLTPGQEKVIRQTLYYQLSNINSGLLNYVDMECTLTSPSTGGSACVKLWRPVAKFTGSVTAGVSVENNNTFLTPNTNQDAGDEIIESNGNFKVRFGASITRKANSGTDADEAGGTASTKWHIIRTSNGSNLTSSRIPSGTGDNTTSALGNGNTDNVVEVNNNSNDYVYTGRLKYGEVRTICAVLSFDKIVSAKDGNTPDTVEKCVKVWRKPKKCDLNTASETYEFGVYTGRNLGRIGVVNRTYSGNDNYVYTNNSPSSFVRSGNTNNYYTPAVSVWARPGDSIRFVQESCAGGAYAVNNSSLSNTTYKTTYTSTGSLGDGKTSDNSSTGYLFGNSFANATQSNPLKYPSSVSWDNGGTETDNFPYKENVEFKYSSPSGNNSTPSGYTNGAYSDSPHNQSSYSCVNLENGASFVSNHYQIAGQATASDAGCHAYSRTAVASDVGHTITQSLSWNDVNIIKSVDQNTSTHKHIAKASVKIPYNYTLQPVISSDAESNVAYLGTSITFDVDIITSPRKNNSFGSNESMNTYATISKPTNVTVKTYFVINGHETTKTSLASSSGIHFNNTGNLEGTKNMNTPYASGGHNYSSNSVYIDESKYYSSGGGYFGGGSKTYLDVGDKVCAEVTVTPADSHDIYSAANPTAAVTGASNGLTGSYKDESIALKETGSSSIMRTSCYTIAKKPTMSVEASNTFSGGTNGFVTSRYTKRFTAGGTDYLFGSWSEYGVYGNVKTAGSRGIASGAT